MIDLTLLPEEWRSGWFPVIGVHGGESLPLRSTFRIGDWLVRKWKTYDEIKASGHAVSMSCVPRPPEVLVVGRDVSIEDLYPDLWGDWSWTG